MILLSDTGLQQPARMCGHSRTGKPGQSLSKLMNEGMDKMNNGLKRKKTEPNRRMYPRLKPQEVPELKGMELGQGKEIDVVNISRGGMLLETEMRLRPELKIVLKANTNRGALRIEGVILRSAICSLEGGPRYRSAIEFRQPFELLPEESDSDADMAQKDRVSQAGTTTDAEVDHGSALLTVIAQDDKGFYLEESFSLNNW